MPNLLDACLSVEMVPAGDGPAVPPVEFPIFAAGEIDTTKGKFLFDAEAAASVMADLADYGNELPIDYNHGMAEEKPVDPALSGRAAGWFTPKLRNGALYATRIRWTPAAAAAIAAREWRYQSPWFLYDKETRRIGGLLNTALTNTPATKNLTPLVASRLSARPRKEQSTMSTKVALALGLAETAEESAVLSVVASNSKTASALLSVTGKATAAEALGVVEGWKASAALVPGLQSEVANLRTKANAADVEKVLTKHTKKVSPAMRESWAKLGLLDDATKLEAMLSVMPDLMPNPAKPPEGQQDTTALNADEMAICRASGTSPKDFAAHKAAKAARQ